MKSTRTMLSVFTDEEIDAINRNSALTEAEINEVSGGYGQCTPPPPPPPECGRCHRY